MRAAKLEGNISLRLGPRGEKHAVGAGSLRAGFQNLDERTIGPPKPDALNQVAVAPYRGRFALDEGGFHRALRKAAQRLAAHLRPRATKERTCGDSARRILTPAPMNSATAVASTPPLPTYVTA